ncbi:hypothetical protein FQA39_LY16539 [Lamprigera yunnana]|nr:hypothetical protein FQA39_LY16539 [Lamprigera yunnana]
MALSSPFVRFFVWNLRLLGFPFLTIAIPIAPLKSSGRGKEFNVDSVATSCIQLAKERIIKYSDPKYNINDFKTGDCETMLFNQTIYYLNFDMMWKSRQIGSKTLTFEMIEEKKILRIEDMCGNKVYLG